MKKERIVAVEAVISYSRNIVQQLILFRRSISRNEWQFLIKHERRVPMKRNFLAKTDFNADSLTLKCLVSSIPRDKHFLTACRSDRNSINEENNRVRRDSFAVEWRKSIENVVDVANVHPDEEIISVKTESTGIGLFFSNARMFK